MKNLLKKFPVTPHNILKVLSAVLAGFVALVVLLLIIKTSFPTTHLSKFGGGQMFNVAYDGAPVFSSPGPMDMMPGYEMGMKGDYSGSPVSLSVRNAYNSMPVPSYGTTGNSAENFEVTDYSATIESQNLEKTCGVINGWKPLSYVIFENSNQYDRGCNFAFKVEHKHVAEILAALKELDPKTLSESIYTIKNQIDDFTSQEDILKKKLASIDSTLANAIRSYDEIAAVATKAQSPESLAKIIDSKIELIERLTGERININSELDRLARNKGQQVDRLEYTYFNVSVYENKYFDFRDIKDSWKQALRSFFSDVNEVVQGVTINLLVLVLFVAQFVLYALILIFVAKYMWRVVKHIWKS
ncbi:MAG: hypothetical protein V4467_04355 [Patescibacteria group bacterium]